VTAPVRGARMTHEESLAQIEAAQAGDVRARNAVIAANMGLVVKLAAQFAKRWRRMDLMADLVQAGVVGNGGNQGGLIAAIEHFNVKAGFHFSTYAKHYVDTAFLECLTLGTPGFNANETAARRERKIRSVAAALARRLDRAATPDEIRADYARRNVALPTPAAIERAMLDTHAISVDLDTLDGAAVDIANEIDAGRASDAVRAALQVLTNTEQRLIAQRFGLGDSDERSLREIAVDMRLSGERVRQLEVRALAKLKRALRQQAGGLT
jgi:RNA polymerase nonessential primary-like sigma factor